MNKQLNWFETLYDNYGDAIFRHLAYKLNDRERAKELTQDTFMNVWRYVLRGNSIENEKAFLYRTAHNLFVNEIRTNRNTTSLDQLEEAGLDPIDEKDTTERFAEYQELLDHLSGLKDSYREVLIMRYIDELTVKEIAALLDEHETNISMRIKRGLGALENTYQK